MLRKAYPVVGAMLLTAAMWFWVQDIAIAHQQADAAVHGVPRGNLSDLYPRWLGARELLLHGRNPYGADITREIQTGYYGRPIDPGKPNDPKDQQGFAYPVYVTFLLAPTVNSPFTLVQRVFLLLLVILTGCSIPLWMKALGWRVSLWTGLLWIILVWGCFPAIQGFKLQQLTLLVAGLLAATLSALASGFFVFAGILLAFAGIKPQLVALPALFLCIWTLGNWRERQRFLWSYAATMLLLVLGGEILLPGWIAKFRAASADYWQYTGGGRSVLDVELSPGIGRVISAILVCVLLYFAWRLRRSPVHSLDFAWLLALTLATTLMVIPMFAPYNQLLLVPVFMVIVRAIRPLWRAGVLARFFVAVTAFSVFWPWIAAACLLAALLFQPASVVQRSWAMPLFTNFAIPTLTLGLVLIGKNVIRTAEVSELRDAAKRA
jgi:hypothetical protein